MPVRWPHLLLIFLVALTLRGAFVLTRPGAVIHSEANEQEQAAPNLLATGQYPDAMEYDYLARNLLRTGQYQEREGRQASRAPGYPLFLAGLYKAGLDSPRAVGLVQALLDAAMCLLLALLGRRIFGAPAGAVAGWMAAVYPFFIYFTWLLLAETAFTLGLVALLILLVRMTETTDACAVPVQSEIRNHPSPRPPRSSSPAEVAKLRRAGLCGEHSPLLLAVPAGLLCGALTLLRSSFFLMPLFLLPFLLIPPGRRLRRAAAWGVMVAVMALALTPWVVRNYRIFHRVIPTTLQVGESLYEACSPYADGGPAMDRIDWDKERGGKMGEYENNEFFKNAALKYMRENPGRCLKLAAVKFVRFWNILPNYSEFRNPLYAAISILSSIPILLLALVGLWRCRKGRADPNKPCEGSSNPSQGCAEAGGDANRCRFAFLLLAPVIYYTLMHVVFVGSVRYRTPIMPFVLLFAAVGAVRLWRRGKPRMNTDKHG